MQALDNQHVETTASKTSHLASSSQVRQFKSRVLTGIIVWSVAPLFFNCSSWLPQLVSRPSHSNTFGFAADSGPLARQWPHLPNYHELPVSGGLPSSASSASEWRSAPLDSLVCLLLQLTCLAETCGTLQVFQTDKLAAKQLEHPSTTLLKLIQQTSA